MLVEILVEELKKKSLVRSNKGEKNILIRAEEKYISKSVMLIKC